MSETNHFEVVLSGIRVLKQDVAELTVALETIRGDIRGYLNGEWDGNAEGWKALADRADAALATVKGE